MNPATEEKYTKPPIYEGCIGRFPLALVEVSKVSAWGTKKHEVPLSDMSYLNVPDAYSVYTNALARHMVKEAADGPLNAQDANLLHAAQAAWNALARLEVLMRDIKARAVTHVPYPEYDGSLYDEEVSSREPIEESST